MSFPALEAAEAELTKIFNEAGPDCDLSKVKSLTGTNAAKAGKIRELNETVGELRKVADQAQLGHAERGDGANPDINGGTGGGRFDGAKRTLEAAFKSAGLDADAAGRAEALLSQGTTQDQTLAAQWVDAAGDAAYLSAFAKLAKDPSRGHMLWTERERGAYQKAKAVQGQLKAGSITGNSELLPLNLDPTIMLTSNGSINPLRAISRVVQTVSNTWQGVTSAGVTAEWKAEGAQMTDASPGTDPAPIPVHFGDAWVPFSFELDQDAGPSWLRDLSMLLNDAAALLQATAYTTGTGTGQPTGIITALPVGSIVASAGADTFAKGDVYALQNAQPPRFQANAQWCANLSIINLMSQMETTAGARLFPELSDGRLLNRPIHELSDMDGTITALADNKVLLYGDFSNFVIADRIGSSVEFVQNVVGIDGRPTGQRGVMLWFRTGSDVVVDNAFRLLNVT